MPPALQQPELVVVDTTSFTPKKNNPTETMAALASLGKAVRDGFAAFRTVGFDVHKCIATGEYKAKPRFSNVEAGWMAVSRHWPNRLHQWQEIRLSADGKGGSL